MQNVHREFLPVHTDWVIRILSRVPFLDEDAAEIDAEGVQSQLSIIGSQERPGYL